jgi:nucleoid-associated protein YgaU
MLLAGNVKGVASVNGDDLTFPAPAADEPTEVKVEFYEIKKGDTLSAIAKEFYGDYSQYPKLFEANRDVIEDADKIYPGQKIRIPLD